MGTTTTIQANDLEVDGRVPVENATTWVKSMGGQIRSLGGYDWAQLRPSKTESMRMARNALWAGAVLCRSMAIETDFSGYMPLNSVGYKWFHELAKLAHGAEYREQWEKWEVQIDSNRKFAETARTMAGDVYEQWSNSDWVYDLLAIIKFAVSRFDAVRPS